MTDINDDGEEELEDEDNEFASPLAQEFQALCEQVHKEIDAKVEAAEQALSEAVELAEKHGVPFRSHISFLKNNYVPTTFRSSKFRQLSSDTISDIAGVYSEYISECFDYGGWTTSAVC